MKLIKLLTILLFIVSCQPTNDDITAKYEQTPGTPIAIEGDKKFLLSITSQQTLEHVNIKVRNNQVQVLEEQNYYNTTVVNYQITKGTNVYITVKKAGPFAIKYYCYDQLQSNKVIFYHNNHTSTNSLETIRYYSNK